MFLQPDSHEVWGQTVTRQDLFRGTRFARDPSQHPHALYMETDRRYSVVGLINGPRHILISDEHFDHRLTLMRRPSSLAELQRIISALERYVLNINLIFEVLRKNAPMGIILRDHPPRGDHPDSLLKSEIAKPRAPNDVLRIMSFSLDVSNLYFSSPEGFFPPR